MGVAELDRALRGAGGHDAIQAAGAAAATARRGAGTGGGGGWLAATVGRSGRVEPTVRGGQQRARLEPRRVGEARAKGGAWPARGSGLQVQAAASRRETTSAGIAWARAGAATKEWSEAGEGAARQSGHGGDGSSGGQRQKRLGAVCRKQAAVGAAPCERARVGARVAAGAMRACGVYGRGRDKAAVSASELAGASRGKDAE
nr:spidroin-1-like [Aegilops tauschii subsp. strangulata]